MVRLNLESNDAQLEGYAAVVLNPGCTLESPGELFKETHVHTPLGFTEIGIPYKRGQDSLIDSITKAHYHKG